MVMFYYERTKGPFELPLHTSLPFTQGEEGRENGKRGGRRPAGSKVAESMYSTVEEFKSMVLRMTLTGTHPSLVRSGNRKDNPPL
jgi:hypothetical protein